MSSLAAQTGNRSFSALGFLNFSLIKKQRPDIRLLLFLLSNFGDAYFFSSSGLTLISSTLKISVEFGPIEGGAFLP